MKRPGWSVRFVDLGDDAIEVFTDPDGGDWIRVRGDAPAELEIALTLGLPPIRLQNIDHWRAPVGATA